MEEKILVRPNTYYDSVTLMSASQKVGRMEGIDAALLGMGTQLNLELLGALGFDGGAEAGPNDLILAVRGVSPEAMERALAEAERILTRRAEQGSPRRAGLKSLAQAARLGAGNLALISVPGAYAVREARQALEHNLHVMLFSDNVSLQDEVELKELAHAKGLLLMGPDCGTAIINGVPLAFANAVRRGSIGIVGASGTGIQEVSVQIHRQGGGISQAIGTGGRDLSLPAGGRMVLDGIEALRQDPATQVIVVISKPAPPEIRAKVLTALEQCGKPAVYCVLGGEAGSGPAVKQAGTLLETASLAVEAAGYPVPALEWVGDALAIEAAGRLTGGQRYVRGLFGGGTLADEAMLLLRRKLGRVYSNSPLSSGEELADLGRSFRHTVLDLGDDRFTVGRPHPMIDYTLRLARLEQEAQDPEVAVILFDVVLGWGSHPDPAAELEPVLRRVRQSALVSGRDISLAAYLCGTERDPQGYQKQKDTLEGAGVKVFGSNAAAAEFAARVAQSVEGGQSSGNYGAVQPEA